MDEEAVLQKVMAYATAEHVEQLCQTLEQAEAAFQNSRLPNDVTIADPIGVADILAEWGMPVPLIEIAVWSAALYRGRYDDFVPLLGKGRARPALHLVNFMNFLTEYRHRAEKCEVDHALFRDFWRPGFMVLMLAMFLNTIRQGAVSSNAPDKKELASQARTVFAPIADHLSLWFIRCEVCDLAFQCEEAAKYAEVHELIISQQQALQSVMESIKSLVQAKAHESEISDLELRFDIAHPYKIHRLRERKRHLGIGDWVSFVALLPDKETCYLFLSALHMIGHPSTPLKDYAARPKANGYRSLHSRINIPGHGPISFYIRTLEWDRESNSGVLSRWWQGEKTAFEEKQLLPQPSKKHIFVYTQQGKPHSFPICATPVDLAYQVAEMTGHRFNRAYVFGKGPVESNYCLKDGDIVEISLRQYPEPDPAWLESVKTKHARNCIRSWETRKAALISTLSQEEREITEDVILPPELEGTRCHICEQCKPHPSEPICAYLTQVGTLTIHRVGCSTIHHHMQTIPVLWRLKNVRSVSVVLNIDAWDHVGLLREITDKILAYNTNMDELQGKLREDMTSHFSISLQERNQAIVENICQDIREISAVYSVAATPPKETAVGAPYATLADTRIINPYAVQPVADPGIFFGRRDEILHVWRALQSARRQNSILFWGPQRIGKTSLLRHFVARAREDPAPFYIPVYLTMLAWKQQPNPTPSDLVLWFASQIEQCLAHVASKYRFPLPILNRKDLQARPVTTLAAYIDQVNPLVDPHQLLVMIDEFQRLILAPTDQYQQLIDCLEHLLVTLKEISFIFAGWGLRRRIPQSIRALTTIRPLDVLEQQAAENLIRMPVRPFIYEEEVVDKILKLTNCHPYYIHLLCGDIIDGAMDRPLTERVLTEKDFNDAVEKLLRGNSAPFSQLLEAAREGDIVLDGLARSPSLGDRYVSFRTLLRHLKRGLSVERLHQVLEELVELEVLEQSKTDKDAYRICLPLFEQWIKRNPLYP